MRQGPNTRRSRGRTNASGSGTGGGGSNGNGNGNGNSQRQSVPMRNQTFDSNGPDVRIRGNAYQVYEKYLALARDATTAGDRVSAENYYQHAEHYFRIISQINDMNANAVGPDGQRRNNRPDNAPANGAGFQTRPDEDADRRDDDDVNGNVAVTVAQPLNA